MHALIDFLGVLTLASWAVLTVLAVALRDRGRRRPTVRPETPLRRPEIDPEVYAAFPELYRPHRSHA